MAIHGAYAVKGHHQPFRGQAKGAGARPAPMQLRTLIRFSAIPSYHGAMCVDHTLRELLCAYGACSCVANVLIGAKDDVAAYNDATQALASGLNARYPAVQPAVRITIRAPRTGGDVLRKASIVWIKPFQPTPLHGRRRPCMCATDYPSTDFNPRLPHGRRLDNQRPTKQPPHFNPRLPHGRRRYQKLYMYAPFIFQPTPPAREATMFCRTGYHFNPRPPHGRRHPVRPGAR